jgi:hypothetical protein
VPFGSSHVHALLTIDSDQDLVTALYQPPRQHVAVHLVVLDQQDSRHGG